MGHRIIISSFLSHNSVRAKSKIVCLIISVGSSLIDQHALFH